MGILHCIKRLPLSRFVDFFWLTEGYVQPHAAERVLPTGCVELVLSLDPHHEADVVSGARTQSLVLDTSKPLSLIGVRFRPGGGFPFVGLPVGELQDLSVAPATLWGASARHLRERLLEATTPPARFRILEEFLLQRLHRSRNCHPAVAYAIDAIASSEGAAGVATLVERSGLSARRFIATFRNEVGLAPKVFCRLARFRRVIGQLREVNEVDWADVALHCGYFDQAHFIHDFRSFAGVSPTVYLRDRTASPNHIRMR